MDVPVPSLVADELGHRAVPREQIVQLRCGLVAIGRGEHGAQLGQHGREPLGLAVETAQVGLPVLVQHVGEVRRFGVDEIDGPLGSIMP